MVDDEVLAEAVQRVMQNPALNADWLPDMVEYYVHKQAAAAVLKTVASIPPVELYGHQLRVVLEPIEKASGRTLQEQVLEQLRDTRRHEREKNMLYPQRELEEEFAWAPGIGWVEKRLCPPDVFQELQARARQARERAKDDTADDDNLWKTEQRVRKSHDTNKLWIPGMGWMHEENVPEHVKESLTQQRKQEIHESLRIARGNLLRSDKF